MRKSVLQFAIITSVAAFLSACGTMDNLHDKLANMQLQNMKKQLANGNTVYIETNVTPTPAWGCTEVGTRQTYNWELIQTEGQFSSLSGGYGLLVKKALAYANEQNLNPNYINLTIPTEYTFTTGTSKVTDSVDLNPASEAIIAFYQCQQIDPEHKLGGTQHDDFSITTK